MSDWKDELQQASFRGVPFGDKGGGFHPGRRNVIHEYPRRNKPWIEDLGRATRKITLTAFLITDSLVYGGGDAKAQRDALVAAIESGDVGTLIHPTLGTLQVNADIQTIAEAYDKGRYFALELVFIETGAREFPSGATNTQSVSASSANPLDSGAGSDFVSDAGPALGNGQDVIAAGSDATSGWVSIAAAIATDATSILSMVATLPGNYGRYFGGRTLGFSAPALIPVQTL